MISACCLTAEPTFPFFPGLCSASRVFQLLLLSPTYVNGHVLQLTLYTMPFNCSFVGRSLGFLKTLPNVFSGLKAVLMISRSRTRRIRSDTLSHTESTHLPMDCPAFLVACLFYLACLPTWWNTQDNRYKLAMNTDRSNSFISDLCLFYWSHIIKFTDCNFSRNALFS